MSSTPPRELKSRIKYYRTVGCRSIYDIIHKMHWSDPDKVSYIRHHFTYYDQHMDMFHDASGFPNVNKEILNTIIGGIIRGSWDASILKDVNKSMIEWRKSHPKPIEEDVITDLPEQTYMTDMMVSEQIKKDTSLKKQKKKEKKKIKREKEKQKLVNNLLERFPYLSEYFSQSYLNKLSGNQHYNGTSEEKLKELKEYILKTYKVFYKLNESDFTKMMKEFNGHKKLVKRYNKYWNRKEKEKQEETA